MNAASAMEMSPREACRFALRVDLFRQRGRTLEEAQELARRCLLRDRPYMGDVDDRRFCPECVHWKPFGRCRAIPRGGMDWNILYRCHLFQWQVPDGAHTNTNNINGVA